MQGQTSLDIRYTMRDTWLNVGMLAFHSPTCSIRARVLSIDLDREAGSPL